jgi:hypothetical protein
MARMEAVGRLTSWAIPAGACFVAFLMVVNDASAEQGFREIKVQGSWAYTTKARESGTEYMASIRAAEGSTWFLLACRPDHAVHRLIDTQRTVSIPLEAFLVRPTAIE